MYRNNTDGPDNANISDAILFVSSARSDLTKVQRLTLGTQGMQGYELRRVYNNKSWLPWEWVDPPMKLGVEYRTTERYLGNPVYKKMDSDGVIWWSTDQSTWKCEAERVGAYSKTETDTLLQKKADKDRVVNPNLLDNWYFANPVNQRGQTT